jgi:hypothetical protein
MSGASDWTRCGPWLRAALRHAGDTHRLEDVQAMVLRGEAAFWPGRACALVSLVEEDPCERRTLIWLAGGDLDELRGELLPQVERHARDQACRRLLVIGRAGWERALKPQGFAPLARLIAKEL